DSLLTRALTIRRQVDDGSLEVAETLTNLGTLHFHTGDNAKAEAYFREALAIRERELPANDADLATALDNLGVILAVGGDYGSADTYYRRALAIRRQRAQ